MKYLEQRERKGSKGCTAVHGRLETVRVKAGSYGNTKRNFGSGACPKIMGGGVLGLKPPRYTPVAYQTTAPILSQTVADGLSPNLQATRSMLVGFFAAGSFYCRAIFLWREPVGLVDKHQSVWQNTRRNIHKNRVVSRTNSTHEIDFRSRRRLPLETHEAYDNKKNIPRLPQVWSIQPSRFGGNLFPLGRASSVAVVWLVSQKISCVSREPPPPLHKGEQRTRTKKNSFRGQISLP